MNFRIKFQPSAADRHRIAKLLSALVDPTFHVDRSPHDTSVLPYSGHDGDDYKWTLDGHNDWWLFYDRDDPSMLRIVYRYNSIDNDKERALAGWLEAKFTYFGLKPEQVTA